MTQDSDPIAYLIYDGDCPFCQHYVGEILNFRAEHGRLELLNARSEHPIVNRYGHDYNFDNGFLFIYQNRVYYGAEAMFALTSLSSKHTLVQRLSGLIFGNKTLAHYLYPVLAWLRRCYFWLLGKPLIRADSKKAQR